MVRTAATAYRMLHKFWVDAAPLLKAASRSSVVRNAASLYIIQLANYILPLITVPYLVRVLGPSGYGTVAFGQSFIAYFTLLVDYGFNLSATRRIAVARENISVVSRIAFSVWAAKCLLCLISFAILLVFLILSSTARELSNFLLVMFGVVVGNTFFPTWLFQAYERMTIACVINVTIRVAVLIGTLILVRHPTDYILYAALLAAGSVGAGLAGAVVGFRVFWLRAVMPAWQEIRKELAEGLPLFASLIAVSFFTSGNAFILGLLADRASVGYYSAGEKVMFALSGLLGPVSQAAYPRFSKMASRSVVLLIRGARSLLLGMGILGTVLTMAVVFGAPLIVQWLYGGSYEPTIVVMRILAPFIFINAVTNVFGIQVMLPLGHDRAFALILAVAAVANVFLATLLVPLWGYKGMAISVLSSGILVLVLQLAYLLIRGLFPFKGDFISKRA